MAIEVVAVRACLALAIEELFAVGVILLRYASAPFAVLIAILASQTVSLGAKVQTVVIIAQSIFVDTVGIALCAYVLDWVVLIAECRQWVAYAISVSVVALLALIAEVGADIGRQLAVGELAALAVGH